ncbi:hypothetical protein MVEG_06476 [Podila verticillata NRRL 6337]|nr:hypothetical protein MVEG_06476 [Podila verticillata NRRL 6337]
MRLILSLPRPRQMQKASCKLERNHRKKKKKKMMMMTITKMMTMSMTRKTKKEQDPKRRPFANEMRTPPTAPDDLQRIDARINQITDQKIAALETELYEVVRTILASDEAAQYVDIFSGLTAPDPPIAPNFKATFDVVPVIMNLLKPLVLNLRADIRNTLIWLCQGEPGSTIKGRASADDAAKQALADDQAAIVHPNGTIYFMDLFDPRPGSMALDCVKGHGSSVLKGVADLFWERLTQLKEYLMEQLRVAIGLPRYLSPARGHESLEESEDVDVGRAEEEQFRAIEWIVDRLLERVQSISSSMDLRRSEDAIEKEGGEELNVISTNDKEESVGSTKMALPRSPSQARVRSHPIAAQ